MTTESSATFIIRSNRDYFNDVRRIAIEDELVLLRDERISALGRNNGAVIKEKDGSCSSVIRMGLDDILRKADEHDPARKLIAQLQLAAKDEDLETIQKLLLAWNTK